MGKLERVSSSYNAGHLGGVRWKYMGIAFPQARSKLGLLSSIIFNTDVQKATEFLFLLNLVGLLRFILLWVAGDGCLVVCPVFAESRETVLRLTSIAICARDDHILSLFKQSLSPYNLDVHCSGPSKNKAGMNTLHIRIGKGDTCIKNALMEGLQSLPTDLLHPKLALLKDLLKTQDNQLRLSHFPSRLPFHDYIQGDMDDKLLWVLGQDFHSLNVYSINAILRFAGLREITRIQDFDLKTFMRNALQVEAKTPKQQLFVDYINLCKSRAVRSGLPLNVQPNNFHFRCNLNDCKFFAHRKRDLQDHQKLHSKEKIKKYQCDFNGCSYSTDNKGNLQLHKKRHSKDRIKEFKCDVKDCPFKTDQKGNLQVHQRTHLPKDRIKKY